MKLKLKEINEIEAGDIWAMKKKYQEILVTNFDVNKINGLLDKQSVWFKTDNKARLNTFKEQIEAMFGLIPIDFNECLLANRNN